MKLSILAAVLTVVLIPGLAHGAAVASDMQTAVTGNTAFACDLYGKLKAQEGNLFLSPYSISTALAMTYGGARGNTEAQMAKALNFGLPQDELHPVFAGLQDGLNAVQQKGKVKLAVANSLWPQKGYTFLPAYLDLCKKNYSVTITPVDFAGATEQARTTINDWVENKTEKKIQELFKPGVLSGDTRLVLVNAIYFKGNWVTQFDKRATTPQPFHLAAGKDVEAPLMRLEKQFRYTETPDLQALEMPYSGNDLSMVVLLPRQVDGLPALEAKLTEENLAAWTKGLASRKAMVWLPKFKTTAEFSLNQTLAALGMTDAFARQADFSGMTGQTDLFISAVVHKAFVEVNEEGTEAAAATGVAFTRERAIVREEEPVVFRADHPFLFIVRDNHTGSVLFLGRIVDPTK